MEFTTLAVRNEPEATRTKRLRFERRRCWFSEGSRNGATSHSLEVSRKFSSRKVGLVDSCFEQLRSREQSCRWNRQSEVACQP